MALRGPHSEPVLVWRLEVAGVEAVGLHGRSVFAQPLSFRAGPLPHQAAGQGTKVLPRTKSMEKPTRRRLGCAGCPCGTAGGRVLHTGSFRPPDPGPPEASRRFRFRRRRGCFRWSAFPPRWKAWIPTQLSGGWKHAGERFTVRRPCASVFHP